MKTYKWYVSKRLLDKHLNCKTRVGSEMDSYVPTTYICIYLYKYIHINVYVLGISEMTHRVELGESFWDLRNGGKSE